MVGSNDGRVLIRHNFLIFLGKQNIVMPKSKHSTYVCGTFLKFGLNMAFALYFVLYYWHVVYMGRWIL